MQVVFRADASIQIGIGHVMRCLTLADALAAKGAQCAFICREHPGHLIDHIRSKGYAVYSMPLGSNADTHLAHSAWLGSTQMKDAEACAPILLKLQPHWLVVDHYALDFNWQGRLRCCVGKIMVIDDLADRPHDADLILDQNLFQDSALRYRRLISDRCRMLTGPSFSLLRQEFHEIRTTKDLCRHNIERILISFGGTDPTNETEKALLAICDGLIDSVSFDVVLPPNGTNTERLMRFSDVCQRIAIHRGTTRMAELMHKADLAIGASGATNWERCCLGLPALLISVADNQHQIAESLVSTGAVQYLGRSEMVSSDAICFAIESLVKNPDAVREMSVAGMNLVDGQGVTRVIEHLGLSV